ncbi:toxin-antitoxin system YwqK family antitoxin [Georgenia alba]|uniref:Toxin-antitoxin system YwqK family antitoxin n=1 Tax=Georgenia alba TaxID=2233858 RepID=A0ABW2Q274_9MICO
MPSEQRTEHVEHHRGGTVCARGYLIGDVLDGYWEWYRTDGTLKRSGYFDRGERVGEWITYDKHGAPYKVTDLGAGEAPSSGVARSSRGRT